jgi:hypothetical protein
MIRQLTTLTIVLSVLVFGGEAAAQAVSCPQPLARDSVAPRSFARIDVKEFDGRVFIYVPDVKSTGAGFEPFDLWVIEGIYGRPFVQEAGLLEPAAFDRIRASANVRATAVRVTRTPSTGRATIGRQPFLFDLSVQRAASGAQTVLSTICRPAP